jgi:glycerol-3-phosphate acyltransferase PlsX
MIGTFLKEEFNRSLLSKMAAVCAQHVLKSFKSKVDHRKYNGAALLGLRGLVFKSHGSADAWAFESALKKVYDAADKRLLERLQVRIAHAEPLLLSLDFSKT